jgi:uncharacterized protein (DUF983 family)
MMNRTRTSPEDLPFAALHSTSSRNQTLEQARLKAKDLCPACQSGRMDYNGMLNLECDQCGYTVGGCFT